MGGSAKRCPSDNPTLTFAVIIREIRANLWPVSFLGGSPIAADSP